MPGAALVCASFLGPVGLAVLLAYPALWVRILMRRRAQGDALDDAVLLATFSILGKFPEVAGIARYWWQRVRGLKGGLIEYK